MAPSPQETGLLSGIRVLEAASMTPAPRLGEHTREILAEIGLGGQEIDALVERRVIGDHLAPSAAIPGPQ